ncbi:helix-turn-helix domain-containing protein [Bifidobacterium bifidum]|uniref:helix-turn-helix domain-containing protein n=1 Tax=Bifidobacterium bifidum TaxID=1681 RepID=UPI001F01508D|nr:helix-turn-helix domain-containing protein [Bifidobacterium bifidum]
MREDRRSRYDDGFRREALALIKAGAGRDALARRLAMPRQTAEKWIILYRSGGEEAIMGGGATAADATTGRRRSPLRATTSRTV